jgi:hypothetical protein
MLPSLLLPPPAPAAPVAPIDAFIDESYLTNELRVLIARNLPPEQSAILFSAIATTVQPALIGGERAELWRELANAYPIYFRAPVSDPAAVGSHGTFMRGLARGWPEMVRRFLLEEPAVAAPVDGRAGVPSHNIVDNRSAYAAFMLYFHLHPEADFEFVRTNRGMTLDAVAIARGSVQDSFAQMSFVLKEQTIGCAAQAYEEEEDDVVEREARVCPPVVVETVARYHVRGRQEDEDAAVDPALPAFTGWVFVNDASLLKLLLCVMMYDGAVGSTEFATGVRAFFRTIAFDAQWRDPPYHHDERDTVTGNYMDDELLPFAAPLKGQKEDSAEPVWSDDTSVDGMSAIHVTRDGIRFDGGLALRWTLRRRRPSKRVLPPALAEEMHRLNERTKGTVDGDKWHALATILARCLYEYERDEDNDNYAGALWTHKRDKKNAAMIVEHTEEGDVVDDEEGDVVDDEEDDVVDDEEDDVVEAEDQ